MTPGHQLAVAVLAGTALVASCQRTPPQPVPAVIAAIQPSGAYAGTVRKPKAHDAGIEIDCKGGGQKVTITLDAWKIDAVAKDTIIFSMKGSPNKDDYYEVSWKRPDKWWPFTERLFHVPSGGSDTAIVLDAAAIGVYPYNIAFSCVNNAGKEFAGVIDPDIIISGGTIRDTSSH